MSAVLLTTPNATDAGVNAIPDIPALQDAIETREMELQEAVDSAYPPEAATARKMRDEALAKAKDFQQKANDAAKEAEQQSAILAPHDTKAAIAKAALDGFKRTTKFVPNAIFVLRQSAMKALPGVTKEDTTFIDAQIQAYVENVARQELPQDGKRHRATSGMVSEVTHNINRAIEFLQTYKH